MIEKTYTQSQLDVILKTDSREILISLAKQGWALDILVDHKYPEVRAVVASNGYGLDKLINDPDREVRMQVAKYGYGLDKLINDPDWEVRLFATESSNRLCIETANKMSRDMNLETPMTRSKLTVYDTKIGDFYLCEKCGKVLFVYNRCEQRGDIICPGSKCAKSHVHLIDDHIASIIKILNDKGYGDCGYYFELPLFRDDIDRSDIRDKYSRGFSLSRDYSMGYNLYIYLQYYLNMPDYWGIHIERAGELGRSMLYITLCCQAPRLNQHSPCAVRDRYATLDDVLEQCSALPNLIG